LEEVGVFALAELCVRMCHLKLDPRRDGNGSRILRTSVRVRPASASPLRSCQIAPVPG
jgi:hypothetical protein